MGEDPRANYEQFNQRAARMRQALVIIQEMVAADDTRDLKMLAIGTIAAAALENGE